MRDESAGYISAYSDSEYQDQADFRCALRKFLRFSEEQARGLGITPQQHQVLLATRGHRGHPRVTVGDIAEALQIRPHAASLLIDRCVKRGLLSRCEDSEDRRRVLISLTPEGQRLLDRITAANRKQLGELEYDLFRTSLMNSLRTLGTATAK